MLITEIKPKDDILSQVKGKAFIISCEGCREVYFPVDEATELQRELMSGGTASVAIVTEYICNPEHLQLQLQKYMDKVNAADTIMVFSCGVGVQTVAEMFTDKKAVAACDTFPLPGHQGVTPLEYDCGQCGECHLGETGGICPITACSKSLVNGQCGGTKNGMCEVDKDMECGWERIYRRLEKQQRLGELLHPVKVRDFTAGAVKKEISDN